jgi:hypothetical protein
MNWLLTISKYLGPVLLLLVVFYEYKLKHITPDARTAEHKKTSKAKFLILFLAGILGLVALGFDDWNKSQKDQVAKIEREGLYTQITNLTSKVTSQNSLIGTINSNQLILSQQNQYLLNELATNQSIDLGLRERIVDSNRKFEALKPQVADLNSWGAKLNNERASLKIQHEKALGAEQSLYEKCSQYYEYAIKTLADMMKNLAATNGDTASLSYSGLPAAINPDVGDTNVAEIKFRANTNWDFQIQINKRDIGDGRRCITIKGKNVSLDITPFFQGDRLDTYLHVSGEETITNFKPLADAHQTIDESLGLLIAAQAEQLARTSK